MTETNEQYIARLRSTIETQIDKDALFYDFLTCALGMAMKKSKEQKIRLNHPCKICKEIIYMGDGTIMNGEPYHFECFADECRKEGHTQAIKEEIKWLQSVLDTKHIADESRWIIEGRISKQKALLEKEMKNG